MKRAKEQRKRAIPVGIRKVGRGIGIVILILMLPIIAVNTTLAIQKYTKPDEVPGILGISPVFVTSGSMVPAIQLDDLIFFKRVNAEDLQVGDIITYMPPENSLYVVTHRIAEILYDEGGERVFITKGDSNNDVDPAPVNDHQVLGIYFARIPKVGKLVDWFIMRPYGVAICVAAPLVLFLLVDMLRRFLRKDVAATESEEKEAKDELERLQTLVADAEPNEDRDDS